MIGVIERNTSIAHMPPRAARLRLVRHGAVLKTKLFSLSSSSRLWDSGSRLYWVVIRELNLSYNDNIEEALSFTIYIYVNTHYGNLKYFLNSNPV